MSYDATAVSALHEHLLAQAQTATVSVRGAHTVVTDGGSASPARPVVGPNNPRT